MNPLTYAHLTYTSFTPITKTLDIFYHLTNEASERSDRRMLQTILKSAREWHESINNRRLNYDDQEITPIIRLNLNRTFYEVSKLLKVIELKLASIKR